jgi:type I restriction enzyme M protein
VIDEETGSLIEFPEGHPQEGQLVVHQDLVNYDLTLDDLTNVASIPSNKLLIAEAFIKFAQEQGFNFWEVA